MICDLLDRLQELLERQLALVRQGRLDAALELCDQTEPYVRQIAEAQVAGTSYAGDREERIQRLYGDLCLALMAQRTEVSATLNALRRSQRLREVYSRMGRLQR